MSQVQKKNEMNLLPGEKPKSNFNFILTDSIYDRNSKLSKYSKRKYSAELNAGLFCIEYPDSSMPDYSGIGHAVYISLEQNTLNSTIGGFRLDGWLINNDDVIIIKVKEGVQKVEIDVYYDSTDKDLIIPLRIHRIVSPRSRVNEKTKQFNSEKTAQELAEFDVLIHLEGSGDITGEFGSWIGDINGARFIEGFMIKLKNQIELDGICYEAVLGQNWNSPTFKLGAYCGSRGLNLPLLGLRLLAPKNAKYQISYYAAFANGTTLGPIQDDRYCTSGSELSPLTAIKIDILKIPDMRCISIKD